MPRDAIVTDAQGEARYIVISADCHGGGNIGDYRPYLDRATQSDRNVAIASVAPLVVGAALVVGGAVRLARRGKHRARVDIGGWVLHRGGGAVASGRF